MFNSMITAQISSKVQMKLRRALNKIPEYAPARKWQYKQSKLPHPRVISPTHTILVLLNLLLAFEMTKSSHEVTTHILQQNPSNMIICLELQQLASIKINICPCLYLSRTTTAILIFTPQQTKHSTLQLHHLIKYTCAQLSSIEPLQSFKNKIRNWPSTVTYQSICLINAAHIHNLPSLSTQETSSLLKVAWWQ